MIGWFLNNMAKLFPLFSGSTGNSYFLGSRDEGILIDAGKNSKQIHLALERCKISPLAVKAIVITHEHVDHINALKVFASKYNIDVFCSAGTLKELTLKNIVKFPIHIIQNDLQIAGMNINYFNTPHDCAESIGFKIKTQDNKNFAFATDIGCITQEIEENFSNCDFCVIESNHDIDMLKCSDYPYQLKQRVLSASGHLSNKDCAEFLTKIYKTGTKKFLLAHLSSENNYPLLAKETSLCALTMAGLVKDVDYRLEVARKENTDGKGIIF